MRAICSLLVLAAALPAAHADPAPAVTAEASAPAPWSFGVEPRFGAVLPTSKLGAFVVGGLELDKAFGRLGIAADLSLTRPSFDSSVMDARLPGGSATYAIHQTEMVIGLLATYRLLPDDRAIVPRIGAGPVLQLLRSSETTSAAPGTNTAQQTKLGVEVTAGVDHRLGPGFLAGDVRFVYSGLDTMLTGSSNAGSIALAVGYRFVF